MEESGHLHILWSFCGMVRGISFLVIIVCVLTLIWLSRPWSGHVAIANAAYRGEHSIFTASSSCAALNDSGRFNWRNIKSDSDLEKCIISVSRQLKSADALVEWLRMQGFEVVDLYNTTPKGGQHVSAIWRDEVNQSLYPYDGPINRVFARLRIYGIKVPFLIPSGYRVDVVFEADNSLKVSVGPDYL